MSAFEYGLPSEDVPFQLRFTAIRREPKPWKEEVYATARTIASTAGKPNWGAFSGGIDSEFVCRAFFDQGIHFSVLTLEHAGGTNRHDIKYAIKWCRERGVEQRVMPIDMRRFLEDDVPKYAEDYIASQPFRYLQIRLL